MAHKPIQTFILNAKEILVQDIMTMAFLANKLTDRCVTVHYAAHVDNLKVDIAESEKKYNDRLYALEIYVERSPVEELIKFRDTLQQLLAEEEVENTTSLYGINRFCLTDHRDDPPYVYDDAEEEVDA